MNPHFELYVHLFLLYYLFFHLSPVKCNSHITQNSLGKSSLIQLLIALILLDTPSKILYYKKMNSIYVSYLAYLLSSEVQVYTFQF